MKLSTLCLLAAATLLFSCGDEVSQNNPEQIRYQKPARNLNVQVPGSTGNTQSTPTVQQVPFDFGISAVLVAGAVAAVRTARKRRKEEAEA